MSLACQEEEEEEEEEEEGGERGRKGEGGRGKFTTCPALPSLALPCLALLCLQTRKSLWWLARLTSRHQPSSLMVTRSHAHVMKSELEHLKAVERFDWNK